MNIMSSDTFGALRLQTIDAVPESAIGVRNRNNNNNLNNDLFHIKDYEDKLIATMRHSSNQIKSQVVTV